MFEWRFLEQAVKRIEEKLEELHKGQYRLMATLAQLQSDFTAFATDQTTALATIQSLIATLQAAPTDTLSPANQAIVDSLDAAANTAKTNLDSFVAALPAPTAVPVVPPTPAS